MSSEWIATTVGEQATLQRGFDITKATQQSGSIPVISSGGTNSYHNTAMAKGPGVILGRKGVVGSVYFVEEDYWPHDTTLWVKDFHGNDERFTYYFFLSKAKDLAALDVGSANPTLNRNHVHPIKVQWPKVSEQHEIAAFLGTLDDRITLLRETNTTLEAIAQALFKSWFVDFDPVRAKQEGREPEGMDADTAALFPDSFEESELRLVPLGWQITNCQKIIDVRDGTHESPKPSQMGFPLITSRHITGGKINLDDTYLISEQAYENISKRSKVHRLDVLITMIGTVGLTVIVMEDKVEFAIKNIGLFKTSAVPHLCHYFYLLLSSNRMQQYLEARLAGTTQKYLSLKALREIAVLVPSESILTEFSKIISPVFERIHQNNSKAQTLATLRDTLLPRLISGQLRLPDAEALIEEATA